jgi:hypothetical protein
LANYIPCAPTVLDERRCGRREASESILRGADKAQQSCRENARQANGKNPFPDCRQSPTQLPTPPAAQAMPLQLRQRFGFPVGKIMPTTKTRFPLPAINLRPFPE